MAMPKEPSTRRNKRLTVISVKVDFKLRSNGAPAIFRTQPYMSILEGLMLTQKLGTFASGLFVNLVNDTSSKLPSFVEVTEHMFGSCLRS